MNKKVLRVMIILVAVFLVALYVVKIFFPEQFAMSIENQVLINAGNYVDANVWLSKICSAITTFITFFLFTCAVTGKWLPNWKELVAILVVVIGTRFLYLWDSNIANGVTTIAIIVIPAFSNLKAKNLAITYTIHGMSQLLSLKIRNLPMYLTHINSLIAVALTIESYLWLVLCYLYFNYKKGE